MFVASCPKKLNFKVDAPLFKFSLHKKLAPKLCCFLVFLFHRHKQANKLMRIQRGMLTYIIWNISRAICSIYVCIYIHLYLLYICIYRSVGTRPLRQRPQVECSHKKKTMCLFQKFFLRHLMGGGGRGGAVRLAKKIRCTKKNVRKIFRSTLPVYVEHH